MKYRYRMPMITKTIKISLYILLAAFLSNCKHNTSLTVDDPLANHIPSEIHLVPDSLLVDEGPTVSETDELEDGFCSDDIYAQYYIQQYLSNLPKKPRSKRSIKAAQTQAWHYARTQLNGPRMPYFGALPVTVNSRVEHWIRYYKTTGRRDFLKWLIRGEQFKDIILPLLEQEGIPLELFYLAMVESGFNNTAFSSAKATGTWQFMKGTAQLYGLKINYWVDERRDPVKSTLAAATFLRDLYADFGDWHLAMAAYNAGPGRVRRAIRRTGKKDFWAIAETRNLAPETRHYVPKVMAAVLLAYDAKNQGFEINTPPDSKIPPHSVLVNRPILLSEVASHLKISLNQLRQWNPELINDIVPPTSDGYPLRLPERLQEDFNSAMPLLSEINIKDVHLHTIRSGETLYQIARRYKVRLKQILSLNPKLDARRLRIGKQIAVPIPGVIIKG